MPELPEVEMTARSLQRALRGAVIEDVEVSWKRSVAGISTRGLRLVTKGSTVRLVGRRGKYICIELHCQDGVGRHLAVHLRMSGRLFVSSASEPRNGYERVVFLLRGARELRFQDVRKFGRCVLTECPDEFFSKLGLEPLSHDLSPDWLAQQCSKSARAVKRFLLDQGVIAGLGNIYVDEILWRSRIHPLSPVRTLRRQEISTLCGEIKRTIRAAIEGGGTDFGDGVVPGGSYSPQVYGRAGAPCKRCGTLIERIVVAQRGTSFCKSCQTRKT